jgi:hypothetical protein
MYWKQLFYCCQFMERNFLVKQSVAMILLLRRSTFIGIKFLEQFLLYLYNNTNCFMNRLFEAKARFAGEYVLYNIYRLGLDQYEAQLIQEENAENGLNVPRRLIVSKDNGEWQTDEAAYSELGSTLGIEIDAFNHGYGELLGRIGVR